MEDEQEDESDMEGISPSGPLENNSDLVKFWSEPSKNKGSKYHLFLPKELKLGKINRADLEWIMWDIRLIDQLMSIDQPEIANMISTELIAKLSALSSVDGFERSTQTSITHNINKIINEHKKGSGLLGGGGQ